ncbi:YfbM family protein [Nocardia amamiensis]|uniref:YfbM family protein n=1 Tax=Nocardia amamiensis TaxID=404578 RepID=UPI00083330FF|nr:YfbM family protein [Nocardia amamiensis]
MGVILSFMKVTGEQLDRFTTAGVEEEELWDLESADGDPSGYLDKSWDGLRYLLEAAEVELDLFFEGNLLDDEHYGWPVDLVRATAQKLKATPFDRLAAYYDGTAMDNADVYPRIWSRDGDEGLNYLRYHYDVLVAFFDNAARSGAAAVMHFG